MRRTYLVFAYMLAGCDSGGGRITLDFATTTAASVTTAAFSTTRA
jgi:hypothetical protein